ncbi:hypothetical protein ACFX11_044445 [Malus domestica]
MERKMRGKVSDDATMVACRLFDEMPERNMVSWNVMHGGYWKGGKPECALKFRNVMHANVSGLCLFSTFELTIQLPWNVISDFWAVLVRCWITQNCSFMIWVSFVLHD